MHVRAITKACGLALLLLLGAIGTFAQGGGTVTGIPFGPYLPIDCVANAPGQRNPFWYLTNQQGSNAPGLYYCISTGRGLPISQTWAPVSSGGAISIATGQIAVASGTNAIGGSANLTFDLISHRINQTIPTNADAFYAGNVANDPNFQVIYGANGTTPGNLGWSVQQTDDNYNTEAVLSTLPGGRILMEVLTKQPSTPDIQHVAVNPDGTVDIKVYTAHDLIFPLLSGAPNSLVRSNGADPQQMVWDTNCVSSASPAVCSAAPDGNVVIAASGTSVVVNTSAVTANSQIFVQEDQSLGTRLGVTCNTGFLAAPPVISARSAGVSFTIAISAGLAVNPVCFDYMVVN